MTTAAKRAKKKANRAKREQPEVQSESTERSPFEKAAAMHALAEVRKMQKRLKKSD